MLHLHCGLHTCREQGLILGKENFAPHWNFISSYPSTPTWVVPPQYLPPPLTKFLNEALVGSTHTKNNNYTNLYILKDPYWSSMMTVKSCQLASGFVFRILSCSSKPPQTTTQIHIQGSKLPYFRLHKPPHNSIFKTHIFQVTQTTTQLHIQNPHISGYTNHYITPNPRLKTPTFQVTQTMHHTTPYSRLKTPGYTNHHTTPYSVTKNWVSVWQHKQHH